MTYPLVTNDAWKALYQAAIEFKTIKPWTWLGEEQVFGVQNPANGKIGYCCILGGGEEFYGLIVYLGSEGLNSYLKIRSEELNPEEAIFNQNCLMAAFNDRADLDKHDLQVIKNLGLKFRGRNAWPQFRSHLPRFVPWYLTEVEATYLTLALTQAIRVVWEFQKNENLFNYPKSLLQNS